MTFEASKAAMRRNFDYRFAAKYFVGEGIDIGCGPDPISNYREFYPLMTGLRQWDQPDGDGMLLEGVPDESFDFVHSSHSLEHMTNPIVSVDNWTRVLKRGGHMILLLPEEDMFEQGVWPSQYTNGDHLTSWTIFQDASWSPVPTNLLEFLQLFPDLEVLKIEKLDGTFLYGLPMCDQTRLPIGECAIEVVLRKRTQEELDAKGRLPRREEKMFTYKA